MPKFVIWDSSLGPEEEFPVAIADASSGEEAIKKAVAVVPGLEKADKLSFSEASDCSENPDPFWLEMGFYHLPWI